METPHIEHLTSSDYKYVYEPAEDSFLLLDALESDLIFIDKLKPRLCLEIGSGSGIIITALARHLCDTLCLATDINIKACQATQRTAKRNQCIVNAIQCNLVDALQPKSVDLMLFNPPYVVTSDEEFQQKNAIPSKAFTENSLVHSWAGGKDGRRVIDILIQKLDNILSPCGVFYLLLLRENKPDEVIETLTLLKFKAIKYMDRRIPGEHLYIIKVSRF